MPFATLGIVKVPSEIDPVATPPDSWTSASPTRVEAVGAVSKMVPQTVNVGPAGAGAGAGAG